MKDNTRTAIGYICIALVIISYIFLLAWILSPQEFTFKIEMDNNTREAMESIEWEEVNREPEFNHKYLYNNGSGITYDAFRSETETGDLE